MKLAHVDGQGDNPDAADFAAYKNVEDSLEKALFGSPMFRHALLDVWDALQKPNGRRKVLCMGILPRTAGYFSRIFQYLGVKANLLTFKDGPLKHGEDIMKFNENDDYEVLICTYALRLAGHNLHQKSCTVVCF